MSPSKSVIKIHFLNLKNISKDIHKLQSPKYLIGALTFLGLIYGTISFHFQILFSLLLPSTQKSTVKLPFRPPLPGRRRRLTMSCLI